VELGHKSEAEQGIHGCRAKWPVLKTVVAGFEPDLFSAWSCR
jgi:hypothetical protein